MTIDDDEERGRLSEASKPKRKSRLVSPQMVQLVFTVGPWVAQILRLIIELVKLFKP